MELTGLLRNVRRGVVEMQVGFESRIFRFRIDGSIAGCVESVEHDALESGQIADLPDDGVTKSLQRLCELQCDERGAQRMLGRLGAGGGPGRFELQDERPGMAVNDAVKELAPDLQ